MSGSSENKGRMCPDRDSMAALDALLRFRESRSQDPNQEDHHKHGKVDSTPAASTTAPSSVGGASPVGAWAGLATKLNAFLPLNAASILFHSQQQHAANQAHARLAAMQAAATKNWGNTILAAQSAEPPSEILPHGNVAAAPLASSQQTSRTSSPSPSLLPRSQPSPTERKDSLGRTKEEVRKEKVDEALRSKPQRGRKRDNLSEKERLELTRTRNREHAKSTR